MPQPLLHFGNVGIVCQGIGCSRGTHQRRQHAESIVSFVSRTRDANYSTDRAANAASRCANCRAANAASRCANHPAGIACRGTHVSVPGSVELALCAPWPDSRWP